MIEPKPVQYSPWAPFFHQAHEETDVRKLGERARQLQCECPLDTKANPNARAEWIAGLSQEDKDLFDQVCRMGLQRNTVFTRICTDIGEQLKAKRELG